eukprot:CAMPEP_0183336202 /NCGR_PEP_ID=MMETSP0164_2-20130417/4249_1 /TAXON_ID=221442 /ORGANISM="Coccolithus pelagicus ssp braarudi, Strain PLY182g" /LENGTH=258 /DNA_ID=CAMNT_0025505677 /DNA_START=756 /DNA_END=1529 /DNA_ORIENTATION=-
MSRTAPRAPMSYLPASPWNMIPDRFALRAPPEAFAPQSSSSFRTTYGGGDDTGFSEESLYGLIRSDATKGGVHRDDPHALAVEREHAAQLPAKAGREIEHGCKEHEEGAIGVEFGKRTQRIGHKVHVPEPTRVVGDRIGDHPEHMKPCRAGSDPGARWMIVQGWHGELIEVILPDWSLAIQETAPIKHAVAVEVKRLCCSRISGGCCPPLDAGSWKGMANRKKTPYQAFVLGGDAVDDEVVEARVEGHVWGESERARH